MGGRFPVSAWSRSMRAGAGAMTLALAALGAFGGVAAAQQDGEDLRVRQTSAERFPDVTAEVDVPRSLAGIFLPASAFSVRQGDEEIPAEVAKLRDDQLEVAVVVDTSEEVPAPDYAQARGAVAQLVDGLPTGSGVTLVSGGGEPSVAVPRTEDPDEALDALEDLPQGGGRATRDAVALAADALGDGARDSRAAVVLVVNRGEEQSSTDLEELEGRLTDAGVAVHVVEVGEPDDEATRLAEATGGTVRTVDDADDLAVALVQVGDELRGRYELRFRAPAAGPTEFAVRSPADDSVAKTTVELTAPPGASTGGPSSTTAGEDGDDGGGVGSALRALALLLLVPLLLGGIVALVLLWRRGELRRPATAGREPSRTKTKTKPWRGHHPRRCTR